MKRDYLAYTAAILGTIAIALTIVTCVRTTPAPASSAVAKIDLERTMLSMKIGEAFGINVLTSVLRVPGGWVVMGDRGACFVPLPGDKR